MRLPRFKFLSRFRLRVMFQNMANYAVLFVGIFFCMVMLAMAVGMPDTLGYYKENAKDLMFAKYQYMLASWEDEDSDIITTKEPDAEKFSMTSLLRKSDTLDEEVSVYGISDDSRYVKIDDLTHLKENEAYISASYADKYDVSVGDDVTLDESTRISSIPSWVAGIFDKSQSLPYFCRLKITREVFEQDAERLAVISRTRRLRTLRMKISRR